VTRVIAGVAGGRRLSVPPGNTTRPTSDRAREGLFASVLSELGALHGADVMDLYAGSGEVGLEALSRGARSVLLVESDARAAAVIKANVKAVGLPGANVVTDRAERLLARPPGEGTQGRQGTQGTQGTRPENGYALVFADPPYAVTDEAVWKILALLRDGWLAPGALIVVERATRSGLFQWPPGYVAGKSRRYGEATFWYGSYGTAAEPSQAVRPQASASAPALDTPYRAYEE
jgi:16S rRNA (guanine966-N2)-methyltransferase